MTSQNAENGVIHLKNEKDLLKSNIFEDLKQTIYANEIFHITGIDLYLINSNGDENEDEIERKKSELRDLLSNNVRKYDSNIDFLTKIVNYLFKRLKPVINAKIHEGNLLDSISVNDDRKTNRKG